MYVWTREKDKKMFVLLGARQGRQVVHLSSRGILVEASSDITGSAAAAARHECGIQKKNLVR
jgi:hypothetical protein